MRNDGRQRRVRAPESDDGIDKYSRTSNDCRCRCNGTSSVGVRLHDPRASGTWRGLRRWRQIGPGRVFTGIRPEFVLQINFVRCDLNRGRGRVILVHWWCLAPLHIYALRVRLPSPVCSTLRAAGNVECRTAPQLAQRAGQVAWPARPISSGWPRNSEPATREAMGEVANSEATSTLEFRS
jgi:hypothetical protein